MNKSRLVRFVIRDMMIKDYPAVVALWKRAKLVYKPKGRDTKNRIARELKLSTSIFLVAVVKRKIIGVIFGTHDGRKGWINRLAVDPGFQRQGIARVLVNEVEKRFLMIGLEIFACLIESYNKQSMIVFNKMGYKLHKDIFYFTKRLNPDI
ncbi:hypothetical protein A2Y85_05885 [candidate division WOR-3 bacterium RBG_13_43_14]|uniref:N-acetyltransferase domain-containing protein n=1 Tax=candidate division WOR-3 bacterium RBG_13_43_14 TaxID=1802590 RepID=A0A1F4U929_UNCW3|nr:MAG: hypothetical protein A2Y85_05885 [candidate division WOR-3 bacterium RBG_13_43_14]